MLSALTFVSPNLGSGTLSIDSTVFPAVVNADTSTLFVIVYVNGQQQVFGSYATVTVNSVQYHQFSINLSVPDTESSLLFVGSNSNPQDPNDPNKGNVTCSPTVKVNLVAFTSDMALAIGPPTGLQARQGKNFCTLQWATPSYAGFIGVRVLLSPDSSGVGTPYSQYAIVSAVSSSSNVVMSTTSTKKVEGNTTTTTTTDVTSTVDTSSLSIPSTYNNGGMFYAVATTLVQDPTTGAIFESKQNGPVACGFVDLSKVRPTDFMALQSKEDIAQRLIAQILQTNPNLDLSPRSEIRDLFIDPISLELSNMSVKEWFARVSTSVSALAQVDDANGDGVSDPVTSTFKQQISNAFGLNASDTQTLIDNQFNALGEQAGLNRLAATASTCQVTFYTYTKPTQPLSVATDAIVSSVPDNDNPAIQFRILGSGVITPANASGFYDSVNEWWAFTVPAQAVTTGVSTNVGAGTITQIVSGGASGLRCTNLSAALGGTDHESNSAYAERIGLRLIVGVDSGTRNGYMTSALQVPGIERALVVSAGDLEMLRDWDPVSKSHLYGCVDIYAQGNTFSEESNTVAFSYSNSGVEGDTSTYIPLTLLDPTGLVFSAPAGIYTVVELCAQRDTSLIYFGIQRVKIGANGHIFLDPLETAFTVNEDGSTTPLSLNGATATNADAVHSLVGAGSVAYKAFVRYQSPLTHVPTYQPVLSVNSVVGATTGAIGASSIRLIHSSDLLLKGGSNEAGDMVSVASDATVVLTTTIAFPNKTANVQMTIDSDMLVPVAANGTVGNVLSVRSPDLSTLYTFGTDYVIVPTAPYNTFAIQVPSGSAIFNQAASNPAVVVAYNGYLVKERLTFNTEQYTVTAGAATVLNHSGFVKNVWLPVSHGNTSLVNDSTLSSVSHGSRYIKVAYTDGATTTIMKENLDFTLTVDAESGQASITPLATGHIRTGMSVSVSYFSVETFQVNTEYPAFVEQLAAAIDITRHAGADVVIKSMLANPVDISAVISVDKSADIAALDTEIRGAIDVCLSNATGTLYQSSVVSAIMSVAGVRNVSLPLSKMAKSDGAHVVGQVVPTQTPWTKLSSDPLFSGFKLPDHAFLSSNPLLSNTQPSGGGEDDFVGWLYEGEAYRRALTMADFINNSSVPSFYFIGVNDTLSGGAVPASYWGKVLVTIPNDIDTPSLLPFFATYGVWFETGASDITMSSTEYMVPGSITLSYLS